MFCEPKPIHLLIGDRSLAPETTKVRHDLETTKHVGSLSQTNTVTIVVCLHILCGSNLVFG